jgi:glycogen(starch) synthase
VGRERPRIALVSRELHPFVQGGIAPIVRATAQVLSDAAEVTLVTTAAHRARYEELSRSGPLFGPHVRVVFVDEPPEGSGHFYSWLQAWSHRVLQALLDAYPERRPDLVEFPDYLAEGFVTLQAKRTGEPLLRETLVAVRTHTTTEIVGVLNGHRADDLETRAIYSMERYCLRHADRLLWPGGDVLATYRRFYGAEALAPAVEIPDAFLVEGEPPAEPTEAHNGRLRLLYVGRMERRKGVQNLLRALLSMEYEDWELSMLGGDTATGPLGTSMRTNLEFAAAGEHQIRMLEPVPRTEVGRLMREHDAVVIPSRWECWPNTAREALGCDRPVIATPVGGLTALVRPGISGWLAEDNTVDALRAVLDPLARDPEQVRALGRSGGPKQVLAELTDPAMIRDRYLELVRSYRVPRPAGRPGGRPPLVSVVVPYYELDAYVEDTLRSIDAQTYPRIETLVVNDGSIRAQDAVLEELGERYRFRLVTQRNQGLGAARNFGVVHARGQFVLPLDADDVIEPDFVERCVAALVADPDLAYVGTWSRYVNEGGAPIDGADPGYPPLGNWSSLTDDQNVAGSASAVIRRWLFDDGFAYSADLTSYEDWLFFRQLREAGHLGDIIPRALLHYRIRTSSMLRATGTVRWERLRGEVAAHLAEGAIEWTSKNA